MRILDVEKRDEEGIELSGIILICILLLSSVPYSIPTVSGAGSSYCSCKLPGCGLDVHKCGHSPCPYADDKCQCGCGETRRNCPEGECGSTPQPKCPNAPCQPGTCPSIPAGQLCAAIRCTCQGVACDATAKKVTNCPCDKIKCGCRASWTWPCDKSGDCKVPSCYCGCSKPISGPGKCGHGQCGQQAQEGCELYCKCACGNNVIECGQQCGSPQTPKQGCPSYDKYCECRCAKSVGACGRQCGGSPIPGCDAYIEICQCGCKDDVETCRGGQCGTKPRTGCINYVEICNCGCKKTAKECPEGQCGDKPQPGCPSSPDVCRCPCGLMTNVCIAKQCGNLPMPGCPQYGKDCSCSCKQTVSECGQQCGPMPQPGCVKQTCFCRCESTVKTCGYGQCYDQPVSGCKLKPVEKVISDYGLNGWEIKNPDGSTTKICGLNPEAKLRGRGQQFSPGEPGKVEAGGKAGISPALIRDVPIAPYTKLTVLGGEGDGRITTAEVGAKGLVYCGKFDHTPTYIPVVGRSVKLSLYLGAQGGKAVLGAEPAFGIAALVGGGIEINLRQLVPDVARALGY